MLFRKSEALHKHIEKRKSTVALNTESNNGGNFEESENDKIGGGYGSDQQILTSFANELLESQAFGAKSHSGELVSGKRVTQSHLDITEDDEKAYYEQEGREIFGSSEIAQAYEKKILEILMFDNGQVGTCMVKDYNLDAQLDHEEINHPLSFV